MSINKQKLLESSEKALEVYTSFYKSQSLWWRIKNKLQWRFGNIWAGFFGGITPGEKLILGTYAQKK